jgi:hypothetical protein
MGRVYRPKAVDVVAVQCDLTTKGGYSMLKSLFLTSALFAIIPAAQAQTPDDNPVIDAYRHSNGLPDDNFMHNGYERYPSRLPDDNFMTNMNRDSYDWHHGYDRGDSGDGYGYHPRDSYDWHHGYQSGDED